MKTLSACLLWCLVVGVLVVGCNKEPITMTGVNDTAIVIAVVQGCMVSRQDTINIVQQKMVDYSAYDSVIVEKQIQRPIKGTVYSITNDSSCVLVLKFFGETKYNYKGHPVAIVNMD